MNKRKLQLHKEIAKKDLKFIDDFSTGYSFSFTAVNPQLSTIRFASGIHNNKVSGFFPKPFRLFEDLKNLLKIFEMWSHFRRCYAFVVVFRMIKDWICLTNGGAVKVPPDLLDCHFIISRST